MNGLWDTVNLKRQWTIRLLDATVE